MKTPLIVFGWAFFLTTLTLEAQLQQIRRSGGAAPGDVSLSGLTMTGPGILGKADAGSGAVQVLTTNLPAIGIDPVDNTAALTVADYALTGSAATPMLNLSGTWNTSGNPSALKLTITDTASGASAKAIEVLGGAAGTTALFTLAKSGSATFEGAVTSSGNFVSGSASSFRFGARSIMTSPGNGVIQLTDSTGTTFTSLNLSSDLILSRDSANTLALRNGTNAQTFNVYGTYTDTLNYRRGKISTSTGGVLTIGAEGLGSGATGNTIELATDGTTRFTVGSTGNAVVQAALTIGQTSDFIFSGRTRISTPSGGVLLLKDNAGTDFNRLLLGGTTSSFPALKRNSTGLDVRLADDSAYAPLAASTLTLSGVLDVTGITKPRTYAEWYTGATLSGYTGHGNGMFSGGATTDFGIRAVAKLLLSANNSTTPHATIETTGALTLVNSITTGAPNGGTAAAWKMGTNVVTTVVLDTTSYVEVDIGGTLYRLAKAALP